MRTVMQAPMAALSRPRGLTSRGASPHLSSRRLQRTTTPTAAMSWSQATQTLDQQPCQDNEESNRERERQVLHPRSVVAEASMMYTILIAPRRLVTE